MEGTEKQPENTRTRAGAALEYRLQPGFALPGNYPTEVGTLTPSQATSFRAFGIYGFGRLEADLAVGAVAKWFIGRSATPAQSDPRPIVSRNLIAGGVIDIHRTFDQIWTIWFRTNRYVCHFFPPELLMKRVSALSGSKGQRAKGIDSFAH